ncbi:hypothetical protein BGZ60DRAFT_430458 [Tricladium varicosporioides]|nr:hypothetical protein BGZ60DRAFT_430458 [Hymenoscyphus varicosporioides]
MDASSAANAALEPEELHDKINQVKRASTDRELLLIASSSDDNAHIGLEFSANRLRSHRAQSDDASTELSYPSTSVGNIVSTFPTSTISPTSENNENKASSEDPGNKLLLLKPSAADVFGIHPERPAPVTVNSVEGVSSHILEDDSRHKPSIPAGDLDLDLDLQEDTNFMYTVNNSEASNDEIRAVIQEGGPQSSELVYNINNTTIEGVEAESIPTDTAINIKGGRTVQPPKFKRNVIKKGGHLLVRAATYIVRKVKGVRLRNRSAVKRINRNSPSSEYGSTESSTYVYLMHPDPENSERGLAHAYVDNQSTDCQISSQTLYNTMRVDRDSEFIKRHESIPVRPSYGPKYKLEAHITLKWHVREGERIHECKFWIREDDDVPYQVLLGKDWIKASGSRLHYNFWNHSEKAKPDDQTRTDNVAAREVEESERAKQAERKRIADIKAAAAAAKVAAAKVSAGSFNSSSHTNK